MVTAIISLNVKRENITAVAEKLADMEGVSEVYSVTGRWDLVAILRLRKNDDLAELVTNRMAELNGIESTETMIAFRAYSRHDLERMFAVGMEEPKQAGQ